MGYNREFEVNENLVADFLKNATDKVKTSEDVDTLAQLVKLFKKNVPLTLRKYVIALMLKDSLKHYHSSGNNNRRNERNSRNERNDRNSRNDRSESRSRNEYKSNFRNEKAESVAESEKIEEISEERPRHPRVEIDPDKAISIFISIGKNRRVYPRDLVGILIAIAGLDRDRIGDIKVLANYSFVQLYKEDAQQAIDKLNGYDYRGRKLAVSYSRQKEEGEESDVGEDAAAETASSKINSGYEASMSDKPVSEQDMAAEDAAAYAAAEKAAADKTPFGL